MDLIKNKYHIFNPENTKKKGYYPRELLQMIEELPNFEKEFNNVCTNSHALAGTTKNENYER